MVLISIEAAGKKVKGAPGLPYSISFPDPSTTTIEDVKKLLAVKFPKVSADCLPSFLHMVSLVSPANTVVTDVHRADAPYAPTAFD